MLFCLIALWTIAIILLLTDGKSENSRWAAALAISGGFGGLSRVILETVRPYMIDNNLLNPTIDSFLLIFRSICSFISHNGPPYTFIMFSISYSGLFKRNITLKLKYILLLPVLLMLFVTPMYPEIKHNYLILDIWAVPYILFGCFLLLYSYIVEKNRFVKRNRAITNVLVIVPVMFDLIYGYIAKLFHYYELFRVNTMAISILFLFFVAFLIKDGFLGIKLRFEKQILDNTVKAITSGTSILNHTLKNELFKIGMCMQNIGMSLEQPDIDKQDIRDNIKNVKESIDYMTVMVKRIHENMNDIEIKEDENDLNEIISKVVNMSETYAKEKNINIINESPNGVYIKCDKVHVQEILNNIIKNAVEASKLNGEIRIETTIIKSYILISVNDNGTGISKENLSFVFDPFFTTKRKTMNFGLGLTYCYNVMQLHKGSLEIESREGKGTTVILKFPKYKVPKSIRKEVKVVS